MTEQQLRENVAEVRRRMAEADVYKRQPGLWPINCTALSRMEAVER